MKKALLLGFLFIIGCEVDNETRKTLYEGELKKTQSMRDCSVEVIGKNLRLYVVRCPTSKVEVKYKSNQTSIVTKIIEEDSEDPRVTALKEAAEELGYKVEKK